MKDSAAIIISLCALFISFITLYISQLSAGQIKILAGEHLNIGHYKEGNVTVSLSVLLFNTGARTAIVKKLSLLVKQQESGVSYLLEPYFYQKIGETGHFQNDAQPSPIAIAGKQNIAKQVVFRSSQERPTEFQILSAGTYEFTLFAWMKDSIKPDISNSFALNIDAKTALILNNDLKNRPAFTTRIPQKVWSKWQAQTLTDEQIKDLLK